MATMISSNRENPVNIQPARKPGEISSRKPFQDLKPDEPKVESVEQESQKEQELEFTLIDFDVCSGKLIEDDYGDIMSPSKQTQLSDAPVFRRSRTPEPMKEIDFDFDLI